MARIGNSVYDDICPGDPTCSQFGFEGGGKPTPMMAKSMLYKMHQDGKNGVRVDPALFKLAYESRYGKVRIFKVLKVSKKSKDVRLRSSSSSSSFRVRPLLMSLFSFLLFFFLFFSSFVLSSSSSFRVRPLLMSLFSSLRPPFILTPRSHTRHCCYFQWIADPANRVCDAPGSWYCNGQYPPKLQPLIAKQRRFRQVRVLLAVFFSLPCFANACPTRVFPSGA